MSVSMGGDLGDWSSFFQPSMKPRFEGVAAVSRPPSVEPTARHEKTLRPGDRSHAKCQLGLAPTELASFEKETSVISSYEHRELSDACSTGTPARRCPRRARVPVLQVTALSDAVSYTFLCQ